jgi:hypothetical protein
MARQVTHYKCLVISPGDVDDARVAVRDVLHEWNAHAGEGLAVKVEPVLWESHARPEMGGAPQAILNKQIVDDCDFGIAVFWSRLGSPTALHASGSVEEIERLIARGANVMVYFCDAPVPQRALEGDQYQRLQEVKKSFRERGLLATYTTIDELRGRLALHANGMINSLLIQQRAAGQPIPSQGTVTAPMPDIRLKLASAFVKQGSGMHAAISVEVQNHSPVDFFFSNLMFVLASGRQLFVQRDSVTGAFLTARTVAPGDGFTFFVDPEMLAEAANGEAFTVVVAKDKIDRAFRSPAGQLAAVVKASLEDAKRM